MRNNMKKALSVLMAALLMLCLAACGNDSGPAPADTEAPVETAAEAPSGESTAQPESTEAASGSNTSSGDADEHNGVLIVFFSATGTTKGVAEKLAAITGGDLYEIVPEEPYSGADLNWNDSGSRSTLEQNDKSARPAIGSDRIDMTGYDTIYVGFPIWWGEEPRIMDTFVESYSFEGATVIPFCTSSSSGIGRSGSNLAENAKSGNWLEGKRFGGGVTEAELRDWTDSLN